MLLHIEQGKMELPNDIARCPGVEYNDEWLEVCEDCLRRVSTSLGEYVPYRHPPELIVFECEFRIGENE